ncbi:MAG TPA: methylated-DNA--[protein]-cysteine S-methyltransferase, partial [Tepidisphaeraceae bacterium]|nr:methylated-DNA--[protein]-cysteine S-methyltransferase [Tepidisphaeraceae bacterium]
MRLPSEPRSTQLFAELFETPLGAMRAVANDAGILLCDFWNRRDVDQAMQGLESRFAPAPITTGQHPHLVAVRDQLQEYFAGTRTDFTVPLSPSGSQFEHRAWAYLRAIPFGQTRSYGQQAKALGDPGLARAVGRANGMNYIAILIPCHRVIGADGSLTGYGGGMERKRWLLEHERR